jgi:hypothetical protein
VSREDRDLDDLKSVPGDFDQLGPIQPLRFEEPSGNPELTLRHGSGAGH